MASEYFGQNRGDATAQPFIVQVGSSTQGTDIEIRVDTGKSWNRAELDRAIENIRNYIIGGQNTTLPL